MDASDLTTRVPVHENITPESQRAACGRASVPNRNTGVTLLPFPPVRLRAPPMAEPSRLYRALRGVVRVLVRLFFREVAAEGEGHVPLDRGGLLVAWHPNGVIDPAVILARFPGRLVFGARAGLLKWPILGALMRGLGTVPIYRAQDAGGDAPADEDARREANRTSLDALAHQAASGSYTALFPEGQSHDEARPTEIRSGAARLYTRALALSEGTLLPPPALVPVGLHYDAKATFRSRALVVFHEPMPVPEALRVRLLAGDRDAVQELTDRIEVALDRTAHAADSWDLVRTMHRARTLVAAEDAVRTGTRAPRETAARRALGFAQIWTGYQSRRETHPEAVAALYADVRDYDRGMRALGLNDADLDRPPRVKPASAAVLIAAFALVSPVLALGFAVNGPPHWLLKRIARRFSKAEKDTATVKMLVGAVLYPSAWAIAGLLAALLRSRLGAVPLLSESPVGAGLTVYALSAVGAILALWFSERWDEALRAVRVRLTRARRADALVRLRETRTRLHDRFLALADGLDLPASL